MPGPGVEEDAAAADVLGGLREAAAASRAVVAQLRMLCDEVKALREVFAKIEAKPVERPILDMPGAGAKPGTVPLAQILEGGAQLVRALNSGGRTKKKKRRDDDDERG